METLNITEDAKSNLKKQDYFPLEKAYGRSFVDDLLGDL